MKAILVVDIPEDYTGSVISVNLYGRNNRVIHEIHTNKLRPLPSKLVPFGYLDAGNEDGLYEKGYNDCIDEITGETE